ncbi:MAG TPA: RNA methyltransferase [Burkholderiaceae bacterium]|nr:RNA methyltransferase [Burkholderiaceae bacterium]
MTMKTVEIRSAENAHLKAWRRLAESARACRLAGRTLAEGLHLAQAALAAGAPVQAVILREGAAQPAIELARAAAERHALPLHLLTGALYERLAPVPEGAGLMLELAIARPPRPQALAQDAVYLSGVQEPGNVGALLRTAAAAGIAQVAASPDTAYLWSPKVLRAGMGAHFVLALHEGVGAEELPAMFRAERLAAEASGGEDLYSADWGQGPTLWMFGSEGAGLAPAAQALCQRGLTIPVDAAVESLNVAAAAAVCLFEQRRRRLNLRSGRA